jgi:hypothetical protein
MTTNPIYVLHCTYDFAPGYTWSAELKVKPQKKGFAVTGFLSKDDEDGVQRIVGKNAHEPTWRNVATWLESNEMVALAGDVLHSIKFEAAVPWQGEMLAWTWIGYERPQPALYDFLMRCSDDELAELWEANKALTCGDAWDDLTAFAAAAEEVGLLDLNYDKLLQELDLARPATPAQLRRRAEARANA